MQFVTIFLGQFLELRLNFVGRVKIKSLRALFVRVTVLLIFNFSDMD